MKLTRATWISAVSGAVIPLMWYCAQPLLGPDQVRWLYDVELYRVFHIIWPTSILLMGDPLNEHLGVHIIASLGNVVFYAVVGALVCLGINRSRLWLIPPIAIVGTSWWWLFTL